MAKLDVWIANVHYNTRDEVLWYPCPHYGHCALFSCIRDAAY